MQKLLWIGEWEKRGMVQKAKPIPLRKAPGRIWTLYEHTNKKRPPKLPFHPVHLQGAFQEDWIHDWNWRGGKFYYYSRVADRPVWVLLEYTERPPDDHA
jgi:hypothetical protein